MSIFRRKFKLSGYIYEADRHTGWGDLIAWNDFEKRRLYGFLQRKPEVGDEVRFKMSSGKVARFAILNVEHAGDPPDMWFADAMDIGYVGEAPINKVREAIDPQVEPSSGGLRFLR